MGVSEHLDRVAENRSWLCTTLALTSLVSLNSEQSAVRTCHGNARHAMLLTARLTRTSCGASRDDAESHERRQLKLTQQSLAREELWLARQTPTAHVVRESHVTPKDISLKISEGVIAVDPHGTRMISICNRLCIAESSRDARETPVNFLTTRCTSPVSRCRQTLIPNLMDLKLVSAIATDVRPAVRSQVPNAVKQRLCLALCLRRLMPLVA